MRNSFGRRIALQRPKQAEIDAIADEIANWKARRPSRGHACCASSSCARNWRCWSAGGSCIPFIDPIDIRFNRFEPQPVPNANAVMFCLMDVSGSMGEREKDLAKRFFVLLHLFLKRRYERIDIVFIRHTHEAQEVDEETFFYSTAERRHDRFHRARGDAARHRGALSQRASGTSTPRRPRTATTCASDSRTLRRAAQRAADAALPVLRLCRDHRRARKRDLRATPTTAPRCGAPTGTVDGAWPNFQMTRIAKPADIYPVFRELFAKQPAPAKRAEGSTMTSDVAAAVRRFRLELRRRSRAPMRRSRRSRSTSSGSTSIPTRSRSSPPSRCWTPIRRSACR